jgi:hypothetical protein
MRIRRIRLVLAFAALSAGSGVGLADDDARNPTNPVLDDGLLEFLGSVDPASDDDATWNEYLSQADVSKVAKPVKPTVIAAKPATPAPQPSAPRAEQNE